MRRRWCYGGEEKMMTRRHKARRGETSVGSHCWLILPSSNRLCYCKASTGVLQTGTHGMSRILPPKTPENDRSVGGGNCISVRGRTCMALRRPLVRHHGRLLRCLQTGTKDKRAGQIGPADCGKSSSRSRHAWRLGDVCMLDYARRC
jgi:hypothetical protein